MTLPSRLIGCTLGLTIAVLCLTVRPMNERTSPVSTWASAPSRNPR